MNQCRLAAPEPPQKNENIDNATSLASSRSPMCQMPRENHPSNREHESRYGNYRFTFPLTDLMQWYKEQNCGGKDPVLRVYETITYKQEIVYAVLIHSPEDNKRFGKYPLLEATYLEEVRNLENWCQRNNLLLNVSKTKELIVDISMKQERNYQTSVINKSPVERVDSFRHLGVHITQDLSCSCHINTVVKKARQRLYHLRCLRDFRLRSKVLRNFYSCTIESILMGNITTGFGNSTMQDR
ncbi:hypothetical protein QTP86_010399 [Hemibagrus guttatus]|nr:hypothetical protein QTP86_010399 [Hemibagrus guttatus]